VLCGFFVPLTNWSDEQTTSNEICRVGERCWCSLLTYTLVNLQCHLMEEDLLIVTEAQSVVGLRRKQEAIACGGVDSQAFPVRR
jgi:hypothetical protein